MRYAIISDIHGNLEGLNTVMEHAESNGVDKFVCGGDVVGYNANPKECISLSCFRVTLYLFQNP